MAKANRKSWEREGVLEDVWINGWAILPKLKFIHLGEKSNWSAGVLKTWLEHWREYVGDQEDDHLGVHLRGDVVFLYKDNGEKEQGTPATLGRLLKTYSGKSEDEIKSENLST